MPKFVSILTSPDLYNKNVTTKEGIKAKHLVEAYAKKKAAVKAREERFANSREAEAPAAIARILDFLPERPGPVAADAARPCSVRRRMNNELKFPPNFERLVLGCIDADFCK